MIHPYSQPELKLVEALLQAYKRNPDTKASLNKLTEPMPLRQRNDLAYAVRAAQRCLKVANLLGLPHVADGYQRFIESQTVTLRIDNAKRFPLRVRPNYVELARSLFPIQEMPSGASAIYQWSATPVYWSDWGSSGQTSE